MCKRTIAIVCSLALFIPAVSYGDALLNGSILNISGDENIGATFINWNCDQPLDIECIPSPPVGTGDFSVTTSTGTFAQYNGQFGLIKDINNTAEPLNTPFVLSNFITFDLNNNERVTLTFIPLGTDTPSMTCAGLAHCTPQDPAQITVNNPLGLSAFNLDQNATGTAATLGFLGIINDSSSGTTGNITGIFSTQLVGENPAQALAALAAGSSGIPLTFSEQITLSTVPEPVTEPMTLALVGAGLLGLGLFRRRQK